MGGNIHTTHAQDAGRREARPSGNHLFDYVRMIVWIARPDLQKWKPALIADESRKFGLEINKRKTFCITISKKSVSPKCNLDIDGIKIKQVEKFEYLGSLVTSDAKSDQEIKRRIGIAKTAFKGMSNMLTARDINNQTKLRIIKCYIWSAMLYGCEAWTISEAMKKQLEAAEM